MNTNDTICAIATATGGAIGIIRISGGEAISIVSRIVMVKGKTLQEREANTVTFGRIVSPTKEIVDEVLVSIFRAPHSYTGEDSVEISCHGSSFILQQVMQLLIENGCRQAKRGEFTQRAFLNGKMDLSQAEAVADLIASSSAATHRMAMSQMRGDFSNRLSALREKLLRLTSLMELELDFSDHEELEFADRTELKTLTDEIEGEVNRLANSFQLGNALKNGVPVAIVGETNAGKSTLLNALVGEERAIVSDIHGTTRDVIEDTMNINGILFRFIDTAGIRDTTDQIETLGIERTFAKIKEAQIVLCLIDATCAVEQYNTLSPKILPLCKDRHLLIILNKADLIGAATSSVGGTTLLSSQNEEMLIKIKSVTGASPLLLSAKDKQQVDALAHQLADCISLPTGEVHGGASPLGDDCGGAVVVSNLRHYEALTCALTALHRVQDGLATQLPTDLVAQDLRDCLSALAEITGGEITSQETLSTIFSRFCVGK